VTSHVYDGRDMTEAFVNYASHTCTVPPVRHTHYDVRSCIMWCIVHCALSIAMPHLRWQVSPVPAQQAKRGQDALINCTIVIGVRHLQLLYLLVLLPTRM
jgi:hypothetical protein